MLMADNIALAALVTVTGAAMGSFVDALVWRLHTKRNFVSDRSECEKCHHKLAPADLVPIVSWLVLRGKCRYCNAPISPVVPIIEVILAALFLLSFLVWPLGFASWQAIASFAVWLVYLVGLAALFVYDLRWMLLPDKITFPLIGLSLIDAALRVSVEPGANLMSYAVHVAGGVGVLAGLYWLLYTVSKGKWVGYGDVKLSFFIGAVLGWQKSLLVLALANVGGLLIVLPALLLKKITPKSRVPFGPFLIAAFVAAGLFGDAIIAWYLQASDLLIKLELLMV